MLTEEIQWDAKQDAGYKDKRSLENTADPVNLKLFLLLDELNPGLSGGDEFCGKSASTQRLSYDFEIRTATTAEAGLILIFYSALRTKHRQLPTSV
jgi:hypothetical protein